MQPEQNNQPEQPPKEQPGPASDQPKQHPVEPPLSSSKKKVLCIEDEHFINELYSRALAKGGFDVKVVIDGEEGFKEAQSDQYDIILLDIMVPNLMGTEILKRLRNPEITPNLRAKIVITTNLELGEEDRAAIEKQADGYIVKADLTPSQLSEFVKQIKV